MSEFETYEMIEEQNHNLRMIAQAIDVPESEIPEDPELEAQKAIWFDTNRAEKDDEPEETEEERIGRLLRENLELTLAIGWTLGIDEDKLESGSSQSEETKAFLQSLV